MISNLRKNIHQTKVIDNRSLNMVDAFAQLLPSGSSLDMAVGYFYLSGYQLIREELNELASRGPIRILMGNCTDRRTAVEVKEGVTAYKKMSKNLISLTPKDSIEADILSVESGSDEAFSAYQLKDLISCGRLKVKVYTGPSDYFHAKVYLVAREEAFDGYAIIGSSNFSAPGFTGNSELNVLTKDTFPNLKEWFDDLWISDEVDDFSIELLTIIENNVKKPSSYVPPIQIESLATEDFKIPSQIIVREYQKEAVKSWFQHNGQGVLEMATGTGKTITSLIAASKLYDHTNKLAIVIICPYQHLVVQWEKECRSFGLKPILGFVSRQDWEDELNSAITSFNVGGTDKFCLITTNSTFATETMQRTLEKLKSNALVIADECHHLGASDIKTKLLPNFRYRLGLSATPDRWYDDEGTSTLREYFKHGVVYSFPLKDAIGIFLSEYYYYPHIVALTDDESEEYLEISSKIAECYAVNSDVELADNPHLKNLLIKRARLISKAENKYLKVKELVKERADTIHNIFYCGSAIEDGERQVDKLVKILGNELGMRVHPFTSQEDKKTRKELLDKFERGDLQGLVAIKCLDEGVDIPATETAYILASSTNPREFIQRRGRLLRKAKNKKFSYIHDFIVIPRPIDEISKLEDTIFNTERKLVKRELERFKEFAELAINNQVAKAEVLDVARAFKLLDL